MAALSSDPAAVIAGGFPPYPPAMGRTASILDEEAIGEKRRCRRRALHCPVQMIPLSSDVDPPVADAIMGECLDISQDGFYGTVPIGYGMAVGQRYIFRLRTREPGPDGQQIVLRQGVVLRTELLLSADGDQVGFGVRFCGQRHGVLAMPAEA